MSWRTVVVAQRAKLELKMGYMLIRNEDETKRIHIAEIGVLIIETTAVSITASLLNELMKNKIKVIFCDEKRSPSSELLPYYGSHDSSAKIKQQIAWPLERKLTVWTEIVIEKIRRQMELMKKLECENHIMLLRYLEEVQFGDSSNREGHAAKVYFNDIFGKEFSRSQSNAINAALNYGYAIILSAFNREICACGYLTQLGIFHDNIFNQFNLSSDLMEPFRPLVDEIVFMMKPEQFEKEEKLEVLKLLGRKVTIDLKQHSVDNAIKIYCKSVLDALADGDIGQIRFYKNEL